MHRSRSWKSCRAERVHDGGCAPAKRTASCVKFRAFVFKRRGGERLPTQESHNTSCADRNVCRRADGIVGAMRSSGARARHQQRQYAARTGYDLPGHHHNSGRQHGRGQRPRIVLGLMARPERLCDRHELGPGRRCAAPRRGRSAIRRFGRRTLSAGRAAGLPTARRSAPRLLLPSRLRAVLFSGPLLLWPVLPALLVPPLVVAFRADASAAAL